ncbi:hypothetical protein M409DRAFT_31164 [Zasmidium cellare ATCC 36951]|uniref:Uncharacterized protein n=1 Tax=Zasmidium cellare ATCC 36951 TaxID=1080233 RepID=A0A6A6BUD9_ZASCE|nr:uncharacterized protein M409DRAFT_31164 [Zasmidium cellare ATCC 36951]KAF2158305.1 hypothetical protein M409DRAFT_31164 [Zasmidium cellare ATCC 36951]
MLSRFPYSFRQWRHRLEEMPGSWRQALLRQGKKDNDREAEEGSKYTKIPLCRRGTFEPESLPQFLRMQTRYDTFVQAKPLIMCSNNVIPEVGSTSQCLANCQFSRAYETRNQNSEYPPQ